MIKNNKFDKRLKYIPANIISIIGEIDALRGQWIGGAELSTQILDNLKKSVLVTSTGASTRIEGANLSDEDIKKLMRGLSLQKFTDRDKQEVRGYYELLENVFNSWKNINASEDIIKHFHNQILKYTEKDQRHRGDYKKQENKVHMIDETGKSLGVLFDTTPAYLTEKEMQELIEWTQVSLKIKKYHPLLIVGNFIVEFLKIHPFQDGNGRISRVLTNLLLLQAGYEYMPYASHEKLVEDNKSEYYISLRRSQNTFNTNKETIIPWLNFFFSMILKQSEIVVTLLSKEYTEKLLTKKQLAVWNYIQKVNESSPKDISENTGVAYGTVRQVINKLMRLKKIERISQGRSTYYRVINSK